MLPSIFFGGEGEIFARQAACTVASNQSRRPCYSRGCALGEAATRIPLLHLPPAAQTNSPSLTATRFSVPISLRQRKKPPSWVAFVGGEGEIRTLEPLLTVTRFPIVRARPATRLLHFYGVVVRPNYNTTKQCACQYFFKKFSKKPQINK